MKYRVHCVVAAVLLAFTTAALGVGETFRCGTKRIKVGDTEEELLDACGRPDSRRSSLENVLDKTGKMGSARVENYIYEDRDRRSTVHVMVLKGEIVRIYSR